MAVSSRIEATGSMDNHEFEDVLMSQSPFELQQEINPEIPIQSEQNSSGWEGIGLNCF